MPDIRDVSTPLASDPKAALAIEAFLAGVAAAEPTALVKRAVRTGLLDDWLFAGGARRDRPQMLNVFAVGKAAPRMVWGLVEAGVPFRGMGVAPKGVAMPGIDTFRWLPGNHPVPDDASFAAGREALDWAQHVPQGQPVLVLLSGGSSACLEAPLPGHSQEELRRLHEHVWRGGIQIEEMNRQRAALSALKGGRLGRILAQRASAVRVWLIADTDPATAAQTIGSKLFWLDEDPGRIPHRILASADDMVQSAGQRLGKAGLHVYRHGERIRGAVATEVAAFVAAAGRLPAGSALVGAGEPVLPVPDDAPAGGRCHQAALLAAREMRNTALEGVFLAAGSDGQDGTSGATGAWSKATDWDASAQAAVRGFTASQWLQAHRRSFSVGATGTNVNDLWMLLRA